MPKLGEIDLRGRTAIVTGGGRGIGRTLALGLAEHGARVAVIESNGLSEAEGVCDLVRAGNGQAMAVKADVTRSHEVQEMVEGVLKAWHRVDILVNNAATVTRGLLMETSEEEYDRVMAVNVKGVFLCCRNVGRAMVAQGGGSVVNITSVAAERGMRERSIYAASKAAVVSLTKSLALEWAPYHVRVNAVSPAYVNTPLTRPLFQPGEPYYEWILSKTPLRRVLEPEELVGAVVFLASDAASAVTGAVIPVDGGWLAD
jgi:2-dehydro-3-deoxy-D-gluconate 5-dehydrogenase